MRINELKAILERDKLDLAMFCNLDSEKTSPNMLYFSGYNGIGALIIPEKQMPFLIAPKMEVERAGQSDIKKAYSMEKKKQFFESIYDIIKKNKIKSKKIALDNNNFTLNHYKYFKKQFKAKTKDISLDCLKLRQIKTSKEIRIIRKSCNYASSILKKTLNNFKDFNTEPEVAAFLEYEAKKYGLGIAFSPVVASGSNSSMPHHEPKTKLKKGFCVIDFGVRYKGYCSDISRTVYLGSISKKEKEIYNFLLNTQKNIIDNIKINDNCGKIYENCAKSLKNYSKHFIHGLGHGVGVEIHELPNISLDSKDKIMENIVFTIEPGIYIPRRFGLRIEDTVLMKKKPAALTMVTKDLLIV